MSEIRARGSSLPTAEHCMRLWAARHRGAIGISAEEWGIRPRRQHVGAAVGSSTHRGAEHMMTEFQRTGEVGGERRVKTAREAALNRLSDDMRAGELTYDPVTTGPNGAVEAVSKMVAAYHASIDPTRQPLLIEAGLSMTLAGTIVVTGHVDLWFVDGHGEDLKTGRNRPRASSQYGAYSLLARAHGHKVKPTFRQRYLPRVPSGKPQPAPVISEFPQGAIEHQAVATAKAIRRSVEEFRATGDPDSFLANPNTWLCKDTLCPAWGSKWCHAWRMKEKS